jgi:hypothetical protein
VSAPEQLTLDLDQADELGEAVTAADEFRRWLESLPRPAWMAEVES